MYVSEEGYTLSQHCDRQQFDSTAASQQMGLYLSNNYGIRIRTLIVVIY